MKKANYITKLLKLDKTQILLSSVDLSDKIGKNHDEIISMIEELDISKSFRSKNFIEDNDNSNYLLTRDGFAILMLSFNDEISVSWKEKFISAFNYLEEELLKKESNHDRIKNISKHYRLALIASYKQHGATKWYNYSNNTNAIYKELFGGTAKELRRKWHLPEKVNLRDHMTIEQLQHISTLEMIIRDKLDEYNIDNAHDEYQLVQKTAKAYKNMLISI